MPLNRTPPPDETSLQAAEEVLTVSNPTVPPSELMPEQFNQLMTSISALNDVIRELRNDANINKQEINNLKEKLAPSTSTTENPCMSVDNNNQPPNLSFVNNHQTFQTSPIHNAQLYNIAHSTAVRDIYVQPEILQIFPNNYIQQSQDSTQQTSQIVNRQNTSIITENLIQLPRFDGNAEDWPLFYANFQESTTQMGYNDRQNLIRLQRALYVKAKDAVSSMLIYPNEVTNIINELQFNFGRPELLIKSQLEKVQNMHQITESRADLILGLSNKVQNMTSYFKAANCIQHLNNPLLLEQLVSKLPPTKQYEWSKHTITMTQMPSVTDFAKWIATVARIVAVMPNNQPVHVKNNNTGVSTTRRVLHNNVIKNPSKECFICKNNHFLHECKQFCDLNVNDKWEMVKKNNLCFGCLKKGHNLSNCRSKRTCSKENCSRYHNELLHSNTRIDSNNEATTERILICNDSKANQEAILYKMIRVNLSGPNGKISVWAMFDDGASISLIERNIVKKLGLSGPSVPITLQWIGKNTVTEQSMKVSCEISGVNKNINYFMRNVYVVNDLHLPNQTFRKQDFENFQNIPIEDYINVKPSILLGLDNSHLAIPSEVISYNENVPIATETRLGWLIYGPTKIKSTQKTHVLHIRNSYTLDQLGKLIEDNFAVENIGNNNNDNAMDSHANIRATEILETKPIKLENRYEIGFLWQNNDVVLPNNYEIAKRRLITLENKMLRDTSYANKYKLEMKKYIDKNYARELRADEIETKYSKTWYLPHFSVVNPHKPEKLRIVFDAAAAFNDTSLNSVLLKGPEQAQPLITILHKFRQGKIGVAGDIQEMFSQIRIRVEDQNSQRFLWRDGDPTKEIKIFAVTTLIFGAACSPCSAEYIKNFNAKQYSILMPEAAEIIKENMYVDDLVVSFNDEIEAMKIAKEIKLINAAAGSNLTKFVSNSKHIQDTLHGYKSIQNLVNIEPQTKPDKILGMHWNTVTDNLEFHFKFHRISQDVLICKRTPTKRELLGIAMAIYDPFGLITNLTISVKLILQKTWQFKIQWDDELPEEICKLWYLWWKDFQAVQNFTVPRCYSKFLPVAEDVQLHIFVDASTNAYAAVAYFRIRKGDKVEITLIGSKSRCAPIKLMSIPRLELQAAVLGCRFKETILKCHNLGVNKIIFWSDSTTVIQWIKSTTRKFKQFVAHRVSEILATTNPEQWRWLPTHLNAADQATRLRLCRAKDHIDWKSGPNFLTEDENNWPKQVKEETTELNEIEEIKRVMTITKIQFVNINYENYSSYRKIKYIIAWIIRFIENLKKNRSKDKKESGDLNIKEINNSEILLCKQVQNEIFKDEIIILTSKKPLHPSNKLYPLTPFIDEKGLIRVNGRINAVYCLPQDARQPIILPKDHYLTFLIVKDYHVRQLHQNDALIINELRQKFRVPHVRRVLDKVKKRCSLCLYLKTRPIVPLIGQLPIDRLTPFVRPFTYAGVDYCGPFTVTIGRRREKRWVALFTCLTVRAVHLELAENLSTDAFLICVRNFINRRGIPCIIRSDNGTNFIGAQKQLKTEDRVFDENYIQRELGKLNIEWKFNCPLNPNAGGCWERLIQCVKRLLQRILKEETPRLETLRSVLIEAENIVNSRPLTELPITPEEYEPLTPNHFLLGTLNSTQTPNTSDEETCLRKQ